MHAGRSIVRPLSTATTGGFGNPVLSLLEDAGSVLLTIFAFAVPVLAFLLVLALAGAILLGWSRVRRRRTAAEADRVPLERGTWLESRATAELRRPRWTQAG